MNQVALIAKNPFPDTDIEKGGCPNKGWRIDEQSHVEQQ